jgi:hypothetical protein
MSEFDDMLKSRRARAAQESRTELDQQQYLPTGPPPVGPSAKEFDDYPTKGEFRKDPQEAPKLGGGEMSGSFCGASSSLKRFDQPPNLAFLGEYFLFLFLAALIAAGLIAWSVASGLHPGKAFLVLGVWAMHSAFKKRWKNRYQIEVPIAIASSLYLSTAGMAGLFIPGVAPWLRVLSAFWLIFCLWIFFHGLISASKSVSESKQ